MENEKRNPPIKKFRLGQVKAAIWLNRSHNPKTKREEIYHSVTVTRRYTDQKGVRRDTPSFNVQHIPLLWTVLGHAYKYLHELQQQDATMDEPVDHGLGESATAGIPYDSAVFSR